MSRTTFVTFGLGLLAGLALMPVYHSFQKPVAEAEKTAPIATTAEPVAAAATQAPVTSADAARTPTQAAPKPLPEANVLKFAASFPDGGGFNWDGGTGTPEEIKFKGQKILSKSKRGTYCCGFTFAVVMRAATESGLLEGKSVEQIRAFQQHWYAATPKSKEKQQIFALQWLGIGHEVPLLDAQPGDFIRLWHGSSGHSVILLRWITENGKKIGLEYRGTQGSTNGIGNRIEYLPGTPDHKHGDFDVKRTYAGRLNGTVVN